MVAGGGHDSSSPTMASSASVGMRKVLLPLIQHHILSCRPITACVPTTNLLLSSASHDLVHSWGKADGLENVRGVFTSAVARRRGGKKKVSQKLKASNAGDGSTNDAAAAANASPDGNNTSQGKMDKKRKVGKRKISLF